MSNNKPRENYLSWDEYFMSIALLSSQVREFSRTSYVDLALKRSSDASRSLYYKQEAADSWDRI